MSYEIVGMKKIFYNGTVLLGHNCDFDEVPIVLVKYVICLKNHYLKWEYELYEEHGQCYSGWTTATLGKSVLKLVKNFGSLTHVPKEVMFIDFDEKTVKPQNSPIHDMDFKCEYFEVDCYGGDEYYPVGCVKVNMDFFKSTGRGYNKPVIHVFHGASNLCKSYLAHKASDCVYETDSSKDLPDKIYNEIVVVGNKYDHDLEDIKSRCQGHVIDVSFN